MPIYAAWKKRSEMLVRHAMVVTCPDDGRQDSIDSEDKKWECPECKRVWSIEKLRRAIK